jgi:hypothetical protein
MDAMSGIKLNRVDEVQIPGGLRTGNTLITVGKVLLWMDFLLLAFVYVGIRSGSDFWMWWVIIEGVLGLILLEAGSRKRGSLTH